MNVREVLARGRRLLAFALPILIFIVLFFLGRHLPPPLPPDDAFAATPDASPSSSASPVASSNDAAMAEMDETSDAPRDTSRLPLETLADGAVVVDLNLADEDDLRRLPGIGPTRARAIVALRQKLGRFKSIDDLRRIRGIGRAVLRKLRPFARVGA